MILIVYFLQEAADPLVNEAVSQYRNGGSPSKGTADSEGMLEVGYLQQLVIYVFNFDRFAF